MNMRFHAIAIKHAIIAVCLITSALILLLDLCAVERTQSNSYQKLLQNVPLAPWVAQTEDVDAVADGAENYSISTATSSTKENFNYGPSLLISEVIKISHDPNENQISVHLFQNSNERQRKCLNPRLLGRLSGPYVTLIQWENSPTTARTTIVNSTGSVINDRIVGHYYVPISGRYFIEVIGLFCNDPQWDDNYVDVCMENPTMHRLTDASAHIDVGVAAVNVNVGMHSSHLPLGHWKWSPEKRHNQLRPLLTRYQPQKCRSEDKDFSSRCQVPMSLDQFSPYEFEYARNSSNNNYYQVDMIRAALSKHLERNEDTTTLCFVGLSHAREMSREVNLWFQEWNVSSNRVKAMSVDAQFPRLVNPKNMIQNRCNASVIAAGQWSAGRKPPGGRYRGLPPTLFPEYEKEVQTMISNLQSSGLNKFYLRSIHYNALGDVKTTCPPQDWRSPSIIKTYNGILSNLSTSMNIAYIDTNFIVGPLWDISEDFCHYRNDKVARTEALYVLSRLLQDIL